jgi:hypothetical protein
MEATAECDASDAQVRVRGDCDITISEMRGSLPQDQLWNSRRNENVQTHI